MAKRDKKDEPAPINAKSYAELGKAINERFEAAIGIMGNTMSTVSDGVIKYSTGIISLDKYLGIGGLLGGRVVNLWGHEGCGKTLTALTIGAAIQRQKFDVGICNPEGVGRVAMLDAEHTYSPEIARSVGIDPERLLLFRGTQDKILSGEDYFDIIKILIQSGVELIITDSVPALVPRNKINGTVGEGQKATNAAMMADGLSQITPLLSSFKRTIVIFINQVRMKPMVMFGPSSDHTGGEALKYFETYAIEVKKKGKDGDIIKKIPDNLGGYSDSRIGVTVNATLHKNKTAIIPVDPIEFDIYFKTVKDKDGAQYTAGVDTYKDLVSVGVKTGVIKKTSSWYTYDDLKGNGENNLISVLRGADPSVIEKLRNEIMAIT